MIIQDCLRIFRILTFIFCIFFLLPISHGQESKDEAELHELPDLPLIFRKNNGQWGEDIKFKGATHDAQIYFLKNKIVFTHSRHNQEKTDATHIHWGLNFLNSNSDVLLSGDGKENSVTNYLIGNDPMAHVKQVPDYSILNYSNLYKNINLRYYAAGKKLKYDFILKPGSNIKDIQIGCDGVKSIGLKNGELHLENEWGTIKEERPYSYQIINGIKKEVEVSFKLINEKTFGFEVNGDYNNHYDLIIDPVTLLWGTYVGGTTPTNGGYLYDLTTDPSGNIYATGYYPNTFPVTEGCYDNSYNGGYGDVYVFKLNRFGKILEYATYIGGNGDDRGLSIAVNNSGEAYVTGFTESPFNSFPYTRLLGTLSGKNVFICKLNSSGSALEYSVLIGGLNHDTGNGIAVDNSGNAYVIGETQSSGFPVTAGILDNNYNGGPSDGFILKLNSSGTALIHSTFVGGSSDDRCRALVLNGSNEVFVTGVTSSSNFPTSPSAFDNSQNGDYDAFVLRLNSSFTNLIYSTFLGGTGGEDGSSIDINSNNEAFITGNSFSPNYPITVPIPHKGLNDVIVTRLNNTGSAILYSRFIGGTLKDEGTTIIVNTKDHAFIAGVTESPLYPLVDDSIKGIDTIYDKEEQVFITMINETGTVIRRSLKVGGSYDDYKIPSLSFPDKNAICNVAIGFSSHSPDLPTTGNSFQPKKLNGDHANDQPAILYFYFGPDTIKYNPVEIIPYCIQDGNDMITLCAPSGVDPDYPLSYLWSTGATTQCITVKVSDATQYVNFTDGCISYRKDFIAKELLAPKIQFNVSDEICKNQSKILSVDILEGDPLYFYDWSTGQNTSSISVSSPGTYWVTVSNECGSDSDTITLSGIDKPKVNLGADRSFCFPNTYTLNAFNPSDTIFPRTYLWSDSSTNSTLQITSGGLYWVDVTNVCGTVRDEVLIKELFKPDVNLGNDTSMCQNSSITLDAGNLGLPKLWSTGATTQTIIVTSPGIYWVDVTNVCGTTRDSIIVTNAADVPVVNLGNDTTICNSFSHVLDAGNPGSNYYWSTGANTQTITVTSGGVYYVLVTNGCGSDRDTINITAPPALNLELGPDLEICAPASVSFTAENPGGSPAYLWSTGAITPSITVNSTGTYWVRVSNACGIASDTVDVLVRTNPPFVNLGPDTSICSNVDFILDAGNPGAAYTWSTGELTRTIIVNIPSVDTFWVDVTNSCGTTRDSIILNIMPGPIVDLGPDTSICAPANITLDPGNNVAATYSWSTGATTQTITVSSTGLYYVDVTRCQTIRDSIYITTNTTLPVVNLGKDTTICTAFVKVLDAGSNPGSSFTWLPGGELTQSISVSVGDLYIVNVSNGCGTTIDSINIIGMPYESLGPDIRICELDTITLDAKNQHSNPTYLWSTGETTQAILVSSSGVYSVDITNICGTIQETIEISVDTVVCSVDLGPDQRICSPATVTLDAENPGSLYTWNTGETTQTIIAASTGFYSVIVTNGCGDSFDTLFVRVDAGAPSANLGPDQDVCNPVFVSLDAQNPDCDYFWYPNGETTQVIAATSGGTYSVKVSNACGSDSTGMVINEFFEPAINLGPDFAQCGGTVTLDAGNPGSSYFWSTGQNSQSILVNTTGHYAIDVFNVCGIFSDDILVVIDQGIPSINLGPDTNLCSPAGLLLDAGDHPMANILWAPDGDTVETKLVIASGNYSVSITNSCGTNADAIFIAANPVLVNAQPDTSICPENQIPLTTIYDAGYSYSWSPAASLSNSLIHDPIASPDTTTTYHVHVSDGICYNIDSVQCIVHPLLNSQIYARPVMGYIPLEVQFMNINPAPTHIWIFGDGDTSYATSPLHTYEEEGVFEAILITYTADGCVETDTITIIPFRIFIPNLITPNKDGKNDRFDLTNSYAFLYVEIYNRWGDRVFKMDGYSDEWDAEGCSDGIYYYYIKDTRFGGEFKGWVQVVRTTSSD